MPQMNKSIPMKIQKLFLYALGTIILSLFSTYLYEYIFESNSKMLDLAFTPSVSLVNELESSPKFEIRLNDESVKNVYLHGVKVRNSGSIPINKTDFEEPIRIYYPDQQQIFDATLRTTQPENIKMKYSIEGNSLLIQPLLLNSGDYFEFDLYTSLKEIPEVKTRISGIAEPNKIIYEKINNTSKMITDIFSIFIAYYLIILCGRFLGTWLLNEKSRKESHLNLLNYLILIIANAIIINNLHFMNNYLEVWYARYALMLPCTLIGFRWADKNQWDEEKMEIWE